MKIQVTQEQFDILNINLNHKMSLLSSDIKWLKRNMHYTTTMMILILAGVIVGVII